MSGSRKSNQSRNLAPTVLLACHHGRDDQRVLAQIVAQLFQQRRILGKAFHENLPCTIERRLDVGHLLVRSDEARGLDFGVARRIVVQGVGQRLQSGLAGDLRLGAAFLLVGQIEIFEALLGFGVFDRRAQRRRQLALLIDTGEDGRTTLFQLTQIT